MENSHLLQSLFEGHLGTAEERHRQQMVCGRNPLQVLEGKVHQADARRCPHSVAAGWKLSVKDAKTDLLSRIELKFVASDRLRPVSLLQRAGLVLNGCLRCSVGHSASVRLDQLG